MQHSPSLPGTVRDDVSLLNISVADTTDLLDDKSSEGTVDIPVGSLSRNERPSWYFVGHGIVDAVLSLGPVLFLVVSGLCLSLNDQPVSPYGQKIKAITLLSPTIFPIIYAAILGRFLRRLGHFMAERGTTLGVLERLVGCQSLFSAFERQISLRCTDLLGVTILIAWLLSPLGGQASLRLLSTGPSYKMDDVTLAYIPVEHYPLDTFIRSPQIARQNWPVFAPLYMAAVQTSRQNLRASMDLFGNVKIPFVNFTTQDTVPGGMPIDEWHMLGNSTGANYTSTFGVPIVGLPRTGNCSFPLVSHYWTVNCTSLEDLPMTVVWQEQPLPEWTSNDTRQTRSSTSTFQFRINSREDLLERVDFEYWSRRNEDLEHTLVTSANCSARPLMVESHVNCNDLICNVSAIRKLERTPSQIWPGQRVRSIFQYISLWMPGADIGSAQTRITTNELIEHWMVNTDLDTLHRGWLNLSTLSTEMFNLRLQTAINTFWDASLGSQVRHNNLQIGSQVPWNLTKTRITVHDGEAYSCNLRFTTITIIISLVLFVAANISMLLGLFTRTPDILGFVAISARDNTYFTKHVTSYLSGLETAKALQDVPVRVGDVRGDATIGHIALATMDAKPKKLSWTKMYD